MREYRIGLEQKYPDPQKKNLEEPEPTSKASPTKSPQKGKQAASSNNTGDVLSAIDSKAKIEDEAKKDDSDTDSVIQGTDENNFTRTVRHMKGTPLPTKLADQLREEAIFDSSPQVMNALRPNQYISDVSAKKTGYQSNYYMKDYNYKEENFLKVDAAAKLVDPRDLRKRTKGQFDQAKVNSPNHNFTRDIQWLHKANPEAQ